MNWVDIMIIVLVVGLAFLGWRNGVIRWVMMLIGGIVGVVLAGQLYENAATIFEPFTDSDGSQDVLGFALVFLLVMVGAWLAARFLKTALNLVLLGWVDNVAGAALGAFVGSVAAVAIISVMGIVPVESLENAVEDSVMATELVDRLSMVNALLPGEFDQFGALFDAVDALTD